MAKTKAPSKKQQKRAIDFKKIKRKLGRKLPPAKNATNTDITSQKIILPEQSLTADKSGCALSKKGLTLKDLLQQTSHHNAKVRKDALIGIRDIFQNHPAELQLHGSAAVEKLRWCITDTDRLVRETLYQLLMSVIFPACKEDNQGPFVSLMMSYVFNAMTHLEFDVRLMAFRIFDLVVQFYPPTFSIYADKILQNFDGILREIQIHTQDKGKIKSVFCGLVNCLSLLPYDRRGFEQHIKKTVEKRILHGYDEPDALKESTGFTISFKKVKGIVVVLISCFQEFIPLINSTTVLDARSYDCIYSILQSIDLAVRFLICQKQKESGESQPDEIIWDKPIVSLLTKKVLGVFPLYPPHRLSEKDDEKYFSLNVVIAKIFLQFSECVAPAPDLLERFLSFMENALLGKLCSSKRYDKTARENNLLSLLPFIPKIVSRVEQSWVERLFQAFTKTLKDCAPESLLKSTCISMIEEMIILKEDTLYLDSSETNIFHSWIKDLRSWIRYLPELLILLSDKHPSSSQAVLRLLLRFGQYNFWNGYKAFEDEAQQHEQHAFENEIQSALCDFYSTSQEEGNVHYGPFVSLDKDSQQLSLFCLYYFSSLNSLLLKSIASCCLCNKLERSVLYQIIEVLHSAYKAGRVQFADHVSFLITCISRFEVFSENINSKMESNTEISNRRTYKALTRLVCSCLSEMGDDVLVFEILKKPILDQIISKRPLDNTSSLLRILTTVDSEPTKFSESDVAILSESMLDYLIEVVQSIPEDDADTRRYYLLPCCFLFHRSHQFQTLFFNKMESRITSLLSSNICPTDIVLNRINSSVSVILSLHNDRKVQRLMSSNKAEINSILQTILSLLSSGTITLSIEERHRIQCSYDRLMIVSTTLL